VGLWLLLLATVPFEVEGWGTQAHQTIAAIASARLTASASRTVNTDLQGRTMESVAMAADNYRSLSQGRWTAPLHYTNLPRSATKWQQSYCPVPPSCVVQAVRNYTSILRAQPSHVCNMGTGAEPCALMFLIHFVGDIHQPLHAGYADDSGGNGVQVSWFGRNTNLHSVWDTSIIQRYESSVPALVRDLLSFIQQNPALVQRYLSVMDPVGWVDESFQIVKKDVYDFVDESPNVLSTEEEDAATAPIVLGEKYYQHNIPIVKERIVAAGVRLAALLNSML